MANRRKTRKRVKVPFPRKQWQSGQAPRVEKPKKGRGSYDRSRESRGLSKDVGPEL
jgi:hypothetical protein